MKASPPNPLPSWEWLGGEALYILQSIAKIDRILLKNEMYFIFHIKVVYICNVFHLLKVDCYDRTH